MKKYIAIAQIYFKAQLTYRFDVVTTVLSMVWRIIFAMILWGAIFTGRDEVGGFTFQAMLSYYVINSFLATVDKSGGMGGEISDKIWGGIFTKYMLIPANPQHYFLSRTLGMSAYYGLFAVLTTVAGVLVFRINLVFTTSLMNILLAVAIFLIGIVFMNSFQFFLGLWALKFHDVRFLFYTPLEALLQFFRGELVPLSLLPAGFAYGLRFLPFTHVTFTPAMLVTGQMNLSEGLAGLAVIAVWTLVMMVISQFTYNKLRTQHEGVGV